MKEWEWRLVNDHINKFNNHRLARFCPSERLGTDERFSIWFGLVGDWVNLGLPHYMHMDCKPEDGCEIQDACCERSMVMMKLKLVKDKSVYEAAVDANRYAYEED